MTPRTVPVRCLYATLMLLGIALGFAIGTTLRLRAAHHGLPELRVSTASGSASWGTFEYLCRPDEVSERGHCEVSEFTPIVPPRMREPLPPLTMPRWLAKLAQHDPRACRVWSNYVELRVTERFFCVGVSP